MGLCFEKVDYVSKVPLNFHANQPSRPTVGC